MSINDEEQDTDQAFNVKDGDVTIGFSPTTPDVGEGLEIQTKLFTFFIHAIRAFDDEISGHNRQALQFKCASVFKRAKSEQCISCILTA